MGLPGCAVGERVARRDQHHDLRIVQCGSAVRRDRASCSYPGACASCNFTALQALSFAETTRENMSQATSIASVAPTRSSSPASRRGTRRSSPLTSRPHSSWQAPSPRGRSSCTAVWRCRRRGCRGMRRNERLPRRRPRMTISPRSRCTPLASASCAVERSARRRGCCCPRPAHRVSTSVLLKAAQMNPSSGLRHSMAILFALAVAAAPATAQKRYDPGATDTEIKVGNIASYT